MQEPVDALLSKVIQVQAVIHPGDWNCGVHAQLFALCEDGCLWVQYHNIVKCDAQKDGKWFLVSAPERDEAAIKFSDVWAEVERLIQVNAKHRKGFRLQEIEDDWFVLNQSRDEIAELLTAYENGEDAGMQDELGDVLGVLFHFAIRRGYTQESLSKAMLAKFKSRFTEEPPRTPEQSASQERIDALEKALVRCVQVIEKGIEIRIEDRWPALQNVLVPTVLQAKAALSRTEGE